MERVKSLEVRLVEVSRTIDVTRPETVAYRLLNVGRSGNREKIEDFVLRLGARIPDREKRSKFVELTYELSTRMGWKVVAHLVAAGLLSRG